MANLKCHEKHSYLAFRIENLKIFPQKKLCSTMKNHTEKSRVSKARYAALNAIRDIRKNKAFARDVLNKTLREHLLSKEDRAFAAKLTLGVAQTLGTLDDMIYRCVNSPDDIKNKVMDCLRISTYEIIYLEKEAHAAVDQGVELVKLVEPRARGLANLVLRRMCKQKQDFPFGNPDTDDDAFARIYAIPKWELDLIYDSLGKKAGRYLISSSNGAPPTYIFVNTIKSSMDQMFEILNNADAKPHQIKALCGAKLQNCILVDKASAMQDVTVKQAMRDGKFIIADIASQTVVQHVVNSAQNPSSMLELCAGKGNKTIMFQTLFQQQIQHQMQYASLDNVEEKTQILQKRVKAAGVDVAHALTNDATNFDAINNSLNADAKANKFDIVFVDAPCSGLGTLRRHPEIKWRLTEKKIKDLAKVSFHILQNASKFVAAGGILAFATCTVTKQENEQVCENFLKSADGQTFNLQNFKIDDKEFPYLRTQTYSGLNDSHFLSIFKKSL